MTVLNDLLRHKAARTRLAENPNDRAARETLGLRPSKEDAECCASKRDDLGRLPIGFCGPDCERRR